MKRRTYIGIYILLISMVTLVFFTGTSSAEKKESKKETEEVTVVEVKQVNGELGFVSKDYVSVVFTQDGIDYDMVFYLPEDSKDLEVVNKKKLKDINVGEQITVQYELVSQGTDQDKKEKRIARKVTYVGKK
ncbi:MAG: hypothetical protein KKC84_00300 [Candidatus Omnitrophica bacterium]|nr:hypothetical protein [Candidatus Omnitrophota bacterium]